MPTKRTHLTHLDAALQLAQCSPDSIVQYTWSKPVGARTINTGAYECFHHFACRMLSASRQGVKALPAAHEGVYDRLAFIRMLPRMPWFVGVVHIWPPDDRYAWKCGECHRKRGGPHVVKIFGPNWRDRVRFKRNKTKELT